MAVIYGLQLLRNKYQRRAIELVFLITHIEDITLLHIQHVKSACLVIVYCDHNHSMSVTIY